MSCDSYELVPLSQIAENPSLVRDVDQERYAEIKSSMQFHGLLHPIGVAPTDDDPDKYELKWGRTRFLAAQDLGWENIQAHVVTTDQTEGAAMGLAENLHRSDKGLDRAILRQRYTELMESLGAKRRERGQHVDKWDKKSHLIGRPEKRQDRRTDRVARNFTRDELLALQGLGVNTSGAEAILKAAGGDSVLKQRILGDIVAGQPITEAIAGATNPEADSVTIGDREFIRNRFHPECSDAGTEQMSDLDWLGSQCGEVRERLVSANNHHCYDDNALLYRRCRSGLAALKKECLKPVLATKEKQRGGSFVSMMFEVLSVSHPSKWVLCDSCSGLGGPDGRYCAKCHNAGFRVGSERI